MIVSCTTEVEEHPINNTQNKITFIANHDDPDGEFVIKHMIRNSIVAEEYTIMNPGDSLELNTIGRTFYMVGERNRVLDTVIVDRGDVVFLTYNDDSLSITSTDGTIASNIAWYNDFHNQVEEAQQELFKEISIIPEYLEELKKPLVLTNDFEIIELRISHLYGLDRTSYNQNKVVYDEKLKSQYFEFASFIDRADLDLGAKIIAHHILNNSIVDKFRRMGATVQEWLYDTMNEKLIDDCNTKFATYMLDFYSNYLTNKHFQKITSLDLLKTYDKTHQISCPHFKKELQRTCIQNLFLQRNKISEATKLLNDYVQETGDTDFHKFMKNKFGVYKSEFDSNENLKGLVVNMDEQEYQFDKLLQTNKGKVILVDFWASWCAPCRMGMPDVKNLEEKYAAEDFEVVYVSIDAHPNPWKRASKDEGLKSKNNYWVPNWAQSDMHKKYRIKKIPRYILYDKSGAVAYNEAPKPDALEDIIDDLLSR